MSDGSSAQRAIFRVGCVCCASQRGEYVIDDNLKHSRHLFAWWEFSGVVGDGLWPLRGPSHAVMASRNGHTDNRSPSMGALWPALHAMQSASSSETPQLSMAVTGSHAGRFGVSLELQTTTSRRRPLHRLNARHGHHTQIVVMRCDMVVKSVWRNHSAPLSVK